MSTPPRFSERKPAAARNTARASEDAAPASAKQLPLSQRLPGMSDYQLAAYQSSATRIGRDPVHPKHASARKAIPMIEAEIRQRADALRASKKDPTE